MPPFLVNCLMWRSSKQEDLKLVIILYGAPDNYLGYSISGNPFATEKAEGLGMLIYEALGLLDDRVGFNLICVCEDSKCHYFTSGTSAEYINAWANKAWPERNVEYKEGNFYFDGQISL